MADSVSGRRRRSKKRQPPKFPEIPLSDEALNALRERIDREEAGIHDPGEMFLRHRRARKIKQKERKT